MTTTTIILTASATTIIALLAGIRIGIRLKWKADIHKFIQGSDKIEPDMLPEKARHAQEYDAQIVYLRQWLYQEGAIGNCEDCGTDLMLMLFDITDEPSGDPNRMMTVEFCRTCD